MGPIRLDLAFRLPVGRPPPLFDTDGTEITYQRVTNGAALGVQPGQEDGSHINDSCFGLGGSNPRAWVNDGLCAFHISIGEAF